MAVVAVLHSFVGAAKTGKIIWKSDFGDEKNNKNLEKAKPEIEKQEKELVLRALRKNCLQTDAHALFFSLSISPCAFHTLVLCTLACAHTHNHTNIKQMLTQTITQTHILTNI